MLILNSCTDPIRPNKKISVFRVTGLKILGRVGKQVVFFLVFFSRKNIILCILKGAFKIIFFSEKPQKNSRFHQ